MFYNTLSITITNINAVKIPIMKHIINILDIIFIYCLFSCPFMGVSGEDITTPSSLFYHG